MEEVLLDQAPFCEKTIAAHLRDVIERIRENPDREGLRGTPLRYAKAMRFLTSGYQQ
ncbi:MAG: GTP cyclohydrolase I, partial [Acidobacteria bacterium]|nr:GTP cyclohydrolase I [Acidobacteriota bacterium]